MTQKLSMALATAGVLILAACQPPPAPVAQERAAPVPAGPASAPPRLPPAPVSASPPAKQEGDGLQAQWIGIDTLLFGMDEAAFRKAWKGALKNDPPAEGASCHHLYPAWVKVPPQIAFMFEAGRFVRYSVESDSIVAPGGGKVGMTKGQIAALYPGRVEEQPHAYTDGQYLRIQQPGGGTAVLLFATDGKTDAARVTEWRVGLPPQIDYVEGCS